jgi:hypothetical protein
MAKTHEVDCTLSRGSRIAWLDGFRDDGRQHGSYQLFARFTNGAHLAAAKGKSLTSSQNRCGSQESQTVGGSEQANLELNRQNLGASRRESHGRVSAGAVGNTADHARMDITVLLGERGREWHTNVHMAGLHKLERRSQRLHEGLSRETASNFVRSSQVRCRLTRFILNFLGLTL